MPLVREGRQDVKDARLGAQGRGRPDPELRSNLVGALEADPQDVDGEAVGVLAYNRDRAIPVLLVDARGVRGRDAVRLEEHHHVLDLPLLDPRAGDALAAHRTDPLDLDEALGLLVDDLQGLHAEVSDQTLGHHLADAAHEAGAEVLLDADERRRLDRDVRLDLELLAVLLVGRPATRQSQALSRLHAKEVTHGRHEVGLAGNDELHDAPGVFVVRVRHSFEHARNRGRAGGG
jgi:hypothetical protein